MWTIEHETPAALKLAKGVEDFKSFAACFTNGSERLYIQAIFRSDKGTPRLRVFSHEADGAPDEGSLDWFSRRMEADSSLWTAIPYVPTDILSFLLHHFGPPTMP